MWDRYKRSEYVCFPEDIWFYQWKLPTYSNDISEYNKAHPCQSLGKGGVVLQKFVQDWIKKNPDKYNYLIMVNESDGESIDSIVSSSSD